MTVKSIVFTKKWTGTGRDRDNNLAGRFRKSVLHSSHCTLTRTPHSLERNHRPTCWSFPSASVLLSGMLLAVHKPTPILVLGVTFYNFDCKPCTTENQSFKDLTLVPRTRVVTNENRRKIPCSAGRSAQIPTPNVKEGARTLCNAQLLRRPPACGTRSVDEQMSVSIQSEISNALSRSPTWVMRTPAGGGRRAVHRHKAEKRGVHPDNSL